MVALPAPWQAATCTPLAGGLTNQNYRLQLDDGRQAFLRIGHPAPESLGIDRTLEWQLYSAAAKAGLAPASLFHDLPSGALLMAWCDEPNWALAPPAQRDAMAALAGVLVALHRLPLPTGQMAVRTHSARYRRQLSSIPPWLGALERALLASKAPSDLWLPCHHDLNPANLLGPRPWVVDWEYGAAGHPGFEIASIVRTHGWAVEAGDALCEHYRHQGGVAERIAFRPFLPWVDYIALLWTLVRREQAPDAGLDEWIERYRCQLE